jgi:hypothetical protein
MTQTILIPQAAAAAGMSFPELCDRIVRIALETGHAPKRGDWVPAGAKGRGTGDARKAAAAKSAAKSAAKAAKKAGATGGVRAGAKAGAKASAKGKREGR